MKKLLLLTGVLLGLLLGACAPPPEIVLVEPRTMPAGSDNRIEIIGSGFELGYNAFTNTTFSDFSAFVDDRVLVDVEWVDASRLAATVPANVPAGLYVVRVITPQGEARFEEMIRLDAPSGS